MNTSKVIHLQDVEFFQFADGTIQLSQPQGLDDPSVIYLHPSQLEFIAETFVGRREGELKRRLSILADRLEELVTAKWLRKAITDECSDGVEIVCRLDGLLDLALEFDGGRLLPKDAPKEEPQPAISEKFKSQKPPANFQQADLLTQ